jgi:hypothetical protein
MSFLYCQRMPELRLIGKPAIFAPLTRLGFLVVDRYLSHDVPGSLAV